MIYKRAHYSEFSYMNFYTKKVLQLSLPMALTQLITMGSGFLCMTMLAKLGEDVLAASALIFSISLSILIISGSLFFSLSVLIGHSYGEKNYLNIGNLQQQGWMLALIISIPVIFIFWNMYPILIFFGQDKNLALIAKDFFEINIWRVTPFFLCVCNQQLCYGVHKQKIDMLGNMLGVVVLLLSAYIFIFGNFGMPALGVKGFSIATTLQAWFYFLFTTSCMGFMHNFQKFELFRMRFYQNWNELKRLFAIGWPISFQISAEVSSFMVGTILVGWLGTTSLAAYQVVMQYQFLIVVPLFAIAQASGILIGQAIGGKQFSEVRILGKTTLRLTIILSILMGLVFILFPKALSTLYLNVEDKNNIGVLHLITVLFFVMAFSLFFDAIRNVLTGSLRGMLDTKFPMMIGILSIWIIGIPLGYVFAFLMHFGAPGYIFGWMLGVLVGAIILYDRWRSKVYTS